MITRTNRSSGNGLAPGSVAFPAVYGAKLAVTVLALLAVTVQVMPEVESHPVQPLNKERSCGAAVRVTTVLRL